MGEMDFLKPVLERGLGATLHFGRVALKPGCVVCFTPTFCVGDVDGQM